MTAAESGVLVVLAFGAGLMNAMAGGGTILTFPALLFFGESAITANATCTLAVLPGSFASMAGYRREVVAHRAWLRTLLVPSLLGGGLGSVLLLRTPEALFARLAPLLVLVATGLFALQAWMARRGAARPPNPPTAGRFLFAWLFQLVVATWGGYFGVGMGILMLAILGILGLTDIHAMNGLKNFFVICVNLVAAFTFALRGAVDWPPAIVMMGGTIAGGYLGARFARRIGAERARLAVVAIGLLVTGLLFWRRA